MGSEKQIWVPWSALASLMANIGDSINKQRPKQPLNSEIPTDEMDERKQQDRDSS